MQISHVRYFLALCHDKNFTLAVKRCGISQPSLTNAIKQFERELGGPLFHRRPIPQVPCVTLLRDPGTQIQRLQMLGTEAHVCFAPVCD